MTSSHHPLPSHPMNDTFINEFRNVQQAVHVNAIKKGFWEAKQRIERIADRDGAWSDGSKQAALHNNLAMIALVISELSEACEALRHGNPPDNHIPEFSGAEAEFADAVIRMMDLAEARGWRLAQAIVAKHAYNTGREHMHGKKA